MGLHESTVRTARCTKWLGCRDTREVLSRHGLHSLLYQKLACKPTFRLRPGKGTRPGAVCVRMEDAL